MFAPLSRRVRASLALVALLSLSACTTGMGAAVDSIRHVVQRGSPPDSTPLDPNFAYLRVTRGSHVGLLWRGSTEPTPTGPIEVYYSSLGEVVRLQHGRLVGALGLATEWRRVEITAPAWAAVAAARQSAPYVRIRDVMPGYRSGVRDEIVLKVIPAPGRTALQRVDPNALTWFEETAARPQRRFRLPGVASDALPPARYGVDLSAGQETVVYAEQCLDHDVCFTWQRWSAAMQQASAPSP